MNKFIDNRKLKNLIKKRKIYVFGTGIDAELLCNSVALDDSIEAFLDNRRAGEDAFYRGKKVILPINIKKEYPIVIAAGRFSLEIYSQMEQIENCKVYIWDELCIYHKNEDVQALIELAKKNAIPYKVEDAEGIIILPMDNACELTVVKQAYLANYLAMKYHAKLYSYLRCSADIKNVSPVMMELYSAINVEGLIDTQDVNEQEVKLIFEDVWREINCWGDINNITLWGIKFGTTIVRDFLRSQIPEENIKNERFRSFLWKRIETIVFWKNYFDSKNVKAVIELDLAAWDGYIRDIAVSKNIKVYGVAGGAFKKGLLNYHDDMSSEHFLEMWNTLNDFEKKVAKEWAENRIHDRINGKLDDVSIMVKSNNPFSVEERKDRVLKVNDKIKILICPHIFEEDCYCCGEQIFDNNYYEWLIHLGQLSEKCSQYDWYLKMHPAASKRDYIIINSFLNKYKNITLVEKRVSPIQLQKEGISYALTVMGTIGHEYPEIGIQVINAGNNPHVNFDFTWNPKTKEEYDYLICNLDKLEKKEDKNGLRIFYAMNYLIYDRNHLNFDELFFGDRCLGLSRIDFASMGKTLGTWIYKEYLNIWNEKYHKNIIRKMPEIVEEIDNWSPDVLYKTKEFLKLVDEKKREDMR